MLSWYCQSSLAHLQLTLQHIWTSLTSPDSNCHPIHRNTHPDFYKLCTTTSPSSTSGLSSTLSLRVYMRHAHIHNSSVLKYIIYLWQKTPRSRSRSFSGSAGVLRGCRFCGGCRKIIQLPEFLTSVYLRSGRLKSMTAVYKQE